MLSLFLGLSTSSVVVSLSSASLSFGLLGSATFEVKSGEFIHTALSEHISAFSGDNNSGDVDLGLFGDVVQSSFSFFFLDLEGDTSDGTLLYSLHQVSSETGNFISHSLGGDESDFTEDLLVEMEVVGQFVEIFLDQDLSSLLGGFGSDSSHFIFFWICCV